VAEEIRSYSLNVADFRPAEGAPDPSHPVIYIAFMLDQPQPSEVWVDRVELKPR
jgi:hypothetical protein